VIAALRAHRVVLTNGPVIDLRVDGGMIGDTVRCGDAADVTVRVTSANWSPFETLILYVNGAVAREFAVPAASRHDFSASVSLPLARDAFIVAEARGRANLFPVVPPQEFEPLNVDAVINALGAGLDLTGLSPAGGEKPERTAIATPLAITNPVWCDRDGNGRFDPPRPPIARAAVKPAPIADVRAAFDAVEESP
jgi:hypothetical protein